MARYVLTDKARSDLRNIIKYLRQRSPQAARQVRTEMRTAMRRLADFPLIGHRRTDLTFLPVRFWSVYSYMIVYRPDQKPLQVVRILHGAQDVSGILRQEP